MTAVVIGKLWGQDEIVSASPDGEVGLWNPENPASGPSRAGWVDGPLNAVAIGQIAGRQLIVAGGADGVVWAWDEAARGQDRRPLARQATTVNAIAIGRAANREVIVTGGRDGTVRVWDAAADKHGGRPGHLSRVQTVAAGVIGDRDVIVSGGDDGFGVWDAATGHVVGNQRPARPGRGLGVRAVAIGWSGHWNQNVLIVASHKGEIAVHEEIGGLRRRLDMLPGSRTQAATGAVRPSEAIVTSGHDGAWAWAWDAGTPRSIFPEVTASKKPEATHAVYVTPVAAGQIGGRDVIVSGSTDRKTCIWDVATSRLETLEMLDSVTGLAVSARYLAVASGIAVAVFLVPHSNQQLQPVARRGKM